MSYAYREDLVPASKYNIKCPNAMTAEGFCVHNTANDASAANEISYMKSNNNQTSYHYAIDDKEVVLGVPLNRNAWHAGDSNGSGNRKHIGIEICYSKSGGARYTAAEENAVNFIASEMKKRGWGIDKVKKHQDFSGKYCPHRILDEKRWDSFKARIQEKLTGGLTMSQYEELKSEIASLKNTITGNNQPPGDFAKTAWDWAKNNGLMDGNNPKQLIPREQVAVILHRFSGVGSEPSEWAKTAWKKACDKKVFDGTNPKGLITREQVAQVLVNAGLI